MNNCSIAIKHMAQKCEWSMTSGYPSVATSQWLQVDGYHSMAAIRWLQFDSYQSMSVSGCLDSGQSMAPSGWL